MSWDQGVIELRNVMPATGGRCVKAVLLAVSMYLLPPPGKYRADRRFYRRLRRIGIVAAASPALLSEPSELAASGSCSPSNDTVTPVAAGV